ncbi:nephronectin isoform X8 [Pseudorca crassidens]|uniref:nephronectin isoform X8 n=1 Tax=Pseudorca crassidens TaxID=82174 RepID=UPI00352E6157
MDFLLALVLGSSLYLQAAAEFDGRWPRQIVSSIGLCRYGGRIDCCWAWARRSWGQCQPFYVLRQRIARIRCQLKAVCQPQCKHGECIGPNKCKCHPGYAGKTCNQDEHLYPTPLDQGSEQPLSQPLDHQATSLPSRDLNECGLKPRPCKHRCMNTYGSYKCYCLNGYMLMPDGSCSSALTCSMANCQYGCDVVKGQIRCQCPSPGLRLAPDGRTCVDIDECATGRASCPRYRQCVNTFGSYICKCHKGFDLMYIGGKYQCHDIDECSLGQYQCSTFARCYNVHGSYKCKCKDGYQGDGLNCVYIPKVMIEPSGPIHVPKENGTISRGDGGHSNWIPDVRSTRWPLKTPYVPAVITSRPTSEPTARPALKPAPQPAPPTELRTPPPAAAPGGPTTSLTSVAPVATVSPRRITVDNRIQTEPQKPRGDVFSGQYLTVSAAKGPAGKAARLLLPLGHLLHSGDLCLSFRHKVTGLHSGTLQVFVRKHGAHGAALWGRNGGHSWRQTRITLRGADVKSVIFKGEKRRGHPGEIGLDDVSLKKGHCSEEREQLQN